jgi:tetratricopeptide (TPR) repeat protein
MQRISLVIAVAVAALVCSPQLSLAQFDQVYGAKGTPTNGTIIKMSPTEVTVDVSGAPRPIAVNEIKRVSYGDDPAELRRAREAAAAGRYEEVGQELAKIGNVTREVIKQDIEFYKAYAAAKLSLAGQGDRNAAIVAMKNFITASPGSFHYFEAIEVFGDLALAAGRADIAAGEYAKISEAPWPDYKMKAAVLEAQALLAQKKYPEALTKYEAVAASGITTPEATQQKVFANIGRAVCLAHTGKPQEGIKLVEDIISKEDPRDLQLFGKAYNALGACYSAAKQPKEALLAYLHTDILFYGSSDAHAEALYHLSKLWTEVNKSDRAVQARNLLKDRYGGTMWASLP